MRFLFAGALLFCSALAVRAVDEENPFKNAKVGDWVEYKMTGLTEGKHKMTVVAKDDKEATYELATTTITADGKEWTAPVRTVKIDLTKPYEPIAATNVKNNVKIETLAEGKEKIKLGEKEFDTRWTKTKVTSTLKKMTIISEIKMWFSNDVPLSGLIKMESTMATNPSTWEIIGWGKK